MDIEGMERRYAAWRLLYISGEITFAEFEQRLANMTVQDSSGSLWRIDAESGHWQCWQGGTWIEAVPLTDREEPAREDEHDSAIDAAADDEVIDIDAVVDVQTEPPTDEPVRIEKSTQAEDSAQSKFSWFSENWGWLAVGLAGVLLFAAIVLLLTTLDNEQPRVADSETEAVGLEPTVPQVDIRILPTATAAPTSVPEEEISSGDLPMVLIPEGSFQMGTSDQELIAAYRMCEAVLEGHESECADQGFETEMPANEVTVNAFYIDKFEITNAQYVEFLKDRQNRLEDGIIWYEDTDERARIQLTSSGWQVVSGFEDHPVTEVTWYGARAYCQWRGGRLPTEAEWEKAARWNPETGEVTLFPWGDDLPNHTLANYAGGVSRTEPVGSYPAGESAIGLQDMAGNVFEWVNDWHDPNYFSLGDVLNPQGPDSGAFRVIKGGSWGDFNFLIRSANRGAVSPGVAYNFIGFRCVENVSAEQE